MGAQFCKSMEHKIQTPSFITSFVEAKRIFLRKPENHTEWLQGGYLLYRSYEVLLQEILSSAQIEISDRWTLGKLIQAVLDQTDFSSNFKQELIEIVEHRNLVAHAHPTIDFTGDIFLDDLEKVRNLATWYLQDFSDGPRLNARVSAALLSGAHFLLPKTVFISYAREDEAHANKLYEELHNRGHKPWMDKKDLIAGQEWQTEIRKAIEKADYFIALMSSKSITKRGFVQKEIRFAQDVLGEIPQGRIYFIPVRLEPCEVPDYVRNIQWVDLHKEDDYDQIFRAIEHD